MADPHDPDSLTNKQKTNKNTTTKKKLERTFRKEYMKKTAVYNVVGPLFIYIHHIYPYRYVFLPREKMRERNPSGGPAKKIKIKNKNSPMIRPVPITVEWVVAI